MSGNRSYTDQDVHRALEEILNGASISESARKFGIPRSTLSEKHSGHLPTEHKMGPPTILSPEEECLLEKWIFHVGRAGFPVTKDQLLDSVQKLLNHSKRKTIFTDNRPGRKWYEAFMRRHPLIVEKQCQNLTAARASVTEEGLRSWFEEVRQYLVNTGNDDILNDPKRIFNMDESGFFLNPKPGKVLVRKGQRRAYMKIQGDEKEMITVLIGGNASGVKTPPLVMFPYQRIPSNIVNDMPDNWAFGRSPNGWMTAESFYEYVTNCFYPWLAESSIVLPIVLFVDGHSSHITYHLSEFCREKKIILIALHPNATHLLQPMDVSVFRSLKCHWLKAALNYPKNNNGARITREKFSKVLQQVLDNDITDVIVANGFVKSGLYPFNADSIDYGQLLKRQKLDESLDINVDNPVPLPEHRSSQFLEQFECKLDASLLQSFKNSADKWAGRCEDTSLFQFWTSIGGRTIPQNGSESEGNSLVVISDQDIEIEYLDTTYEECLEHGQIIEIINSNSNVTELGAIIEINNAKVESADASTATTTSKVQSAVGVSICDTSVPDNLNLETESIPCDDDDLDTATPLNDSDDEMSLNSTDEDATTDMIDATVPSDDFSHVPGGFPKYFQDSMFWPGRASGSSTSSTSKPKRKPKEKVPAVLISKDFVEYLKNKENEKLRLEAEKADRQKQREVKKLEKQKQEEEKEKVMQERKLEKERKEKEKEKVKLDKMLEKQRKEEEKEKRKLEKQHNEESKKKRKTEKQSAIKTRKIEKVKKEENGTTD